MFQSVWYTLKMLAICFSTIFACVVPMSVYIECYLCYYSIIWILGIYFSLSLSLSLSALETRG